MKQSFEPTLEEIVLSNRWGEIVDRLERNGDQEAADLIRISVAAWEWATSFEWSARD